MNINKLVDMASAMCYELVLREDIWNFFSFKGLPRRGEIFNQFIPKEQFLAESFLKEELILLNFVDLFKVLKKRLDDNKPDLDYYEWHARGSTVEGIIVTGILDRLWYVCSFKDFDSFLKKIMDVTGYAECDNIELIMNSFIDRFVKHTSYLTLDKIIFGATYLFKASYYASNKKVKRNEYYDFFEKNSLEGDLKMHLKDKIDVEKLINITIYLLKLEN